MRPLSFPLLLVSVFVLGACSAGESGADVSSGSDDTAAATTEAPPADQSDSSRSGSGARSAVGERPPAAGVSGGRDAVRETLVVVQELERGPIRDEVVVSSKVEADVSVQVYPKLTGLPITKVMFDEGDMVQAGDLLMTLYDTDLSLAEQRAQSTFEQKQKEVAREELLLKEGEARIVRSERLERKTTQDLDRLEGLVSDGLVNVQEVEDSKLLAEQAEDDLELMGFARDGLVISADLARIAESQAKIDWERAQADLEETQVRAPISGVVAERTVEEGELSGQAEAAFRLVDLEHPILSLRVPQDTLGRMREGQAVEVRSVTADKALFHGVVRRVNPVLDRMTGTVSVIVDLKPEPRLLPGLFCEARIVTAARDAALLIDKRAVRYEDDQPVFFALNEDDGGKSVAMIPFKAGASTSTSIEILSDMDGEPISDGLRVVIVGHENLKDGARVRVQEDPY